MHQARWLRQRSTRRTQVVVLQVELLLLLLVVVVQVETKVPITNVARATAVVAIMVTWPTSN
jgi:hypothetical protein